MSNLPTKQTDFGELIRAGFQLFRANIGDIIGIVVIQVITLSALLLLVLSILFSLMAEQEYQQPGYGMLVVFILAVLVIFSICLIFPLAYIKKFQAQVDGESLKGKHALRHSLQYLKNLLLWSLLYSVIILYILFVIFLSRYSALFLVFSIPGFAGLIFFSMGIFLIVLDEFGPIAAAQQSYRLVRDNWWRTVLYLLSTSVTLLFVYLAIVIPITIVFTFMIWLVPLLIGALNIIYALLLSALLPLFIALLFPFYIDLKKSKSTDVKLVP